MNLHRPENTSTLYTETFCSSETLVSTICYIPEDQNMNLHCSENMSTVKMDAVYSSETLVSTY
jgi:hypothetical protein